MTPGRPLTGGRARCREEGWRGFYKGLAPNLTRVVPATAITFVVYESVSSALKARSSRSEPQPPPPEPEPEPKPAAED